MPTSLPNRFKFGHDLSFVLHDLLSEHCVKGEEAELAAFEIAFRSPEHLSAIEGLSGTESWEWLRTNGYEEVLSEVARRSLVFALLSDLCQFLFEGLKSAEKGKLSVAFSLFRKPLQDNLFYLEWMLADWPSFESAFREGPGKIDLSKRGKESRLGIIAAAMDSTDLGRWVDPETIYELRYEKATVLGFDPLFNQAIHLVTTSRHYATAKENINFVFCDDEDRDRLWRKLYRLLPLVLMHALQIVRAHFKTLSKDFELLDHATELWLATGFLLNAEATGEDDAKNAAVSFLNEAIREYSLNCPNCKTAMILRPEASRVFWDHGGIQCNNCAAVFPIVNARHVFSSSSAEGADPPTEIAP